MDKVEKQKDYIYQKLKDISTCNLYTDTCINIDKDYNDCISSFDHHPNMFEIKDILHFFEILLKNKKYEWIGDIKRLKIKSSESFVYCVDIKNFEIIMKTSKNIIYDDDTIREYFIGITSINDLRYTVPNFVCTFGLFDCSLLDMSREEDMGNIMAIYEKIPGDTLEFVLKNEIINFDQYLSIFTQLLIALEHGQRSVEFCHFDLHTSNVILRPINKYVYSVHFGSNTYVINCDQYIPIMIDFGLSSVKHDVTVDSDTRDNIGQSSCVNISSRYFFDIGIMDYLISGVDMYKILFYSVYYAKGKLKNSIINLFKFYGDNDPYDIVKNKGVSKKTLSGYCKDITFSKGCVYTPLDFLDWLVKNYDIQCLTIIDRKVCIPLLFPSDMNNDNIKNVINKIEEEKYNESYVMNMYFLYILTGYDNLIFDQKIYTLSSKLRKNKKKYISNDILLFYGYKDIKIPDIGKICKYIDWVLCITLDNIDKNLDIEKLTSEYMYMMKFFTDMKYYFNFLYTIKELKIEDKFSEILLEYYGSDHYKFYVKYNKIVDRASRWTKTLIHELNLI